MNLCEVIDINHPCKHCGKAKGNHRHGTAECPKGMKARAVGYTRFGPEVFEPKKLRKPLKGSDFKI